MLRFPLEDFEPESPWVLFFAYDVEYTISGNIVRNPPFVPIGLYMPTNYTINDTLSYQSHIGGWVDAVSSSFGQADSEASFLGIVGSLGSRSVSSVGQTAADFVTPGSDIKGIWDRTRGKVTNPNEFSLFQSPQLRTFSFTFRMIPKSQKEADAIPEIIKQFRLAAYPDLTANGIDYTFPKMFIIKILNSDNVIQIPDVACESVSVTYNPTAMSYFRYKNTPAEINLALSFKELRQLKKAQIEQGY